MEWADVWRIVLSILASVGGISGIIIIAVKFASNIIAKRLEERYSLKLNKELEQYKSALENKKHISKVQFDKEFEMYQELSEKNLTMVYNVGVTVMVVRGMPYGHEKCAQLAEKICDSINDADFTTKRYAAFIDEQLFKNYCALQKQARIIFSLFEFWMMEENSLFRYGDEQYTRESAANAIEEKQKNLSQLSDTIIQEMRKYLKSLTVTEDK